MNTKKSLEMIVRDSSLETKLALASTQHSGIEDFINEFLSNFLSPQTKRAYIKDLMEFFDFLKAGNITINSPSDIKSAWFKIYRDEMINHGFAPATINRRLVAVRSFVKWAVAMKLMDHNPLDAVKLPKVSTISPTIAFDDEEVTRMMSSPNITTKSGNTHRLIIVLLFYLGTRRSELVNIRCKDIFEDRGHRVLRIIGKGKKDKLSKMDVVGFMFKKGQLAKDELGMVEVKEYYSFVAIKINKVKDVLRLVENEKIKNMKTKIELAE